MRIEFKIGAFSMVEVVTDFFGGNAQILEIQNKSEMTIIRFAAEHKRYEPQAMWFHFKVKGISNSKLRCVLVNATQCLGSVEGWVNNRPVYRIGKSSWTRVDSVQVQYNEHCVAEVVFDMPAQNEQVEVAFCYPYQCDVLKNNIAGQSLWNHTTIGFSPQGRKISRIYTDLGKKQVNRPGVYFLARQHSGETPGSWVLDGVFRHLASEEGRLLTNDICWWAVPFVDIDGVVNGLYGKDQLPGDLNRSWDPKFPARPEVHAVQHDLNIWANCCKPFIILDLHGPSHQERGFYFHIPLGPKYIVEKSQNIAQAFRDNVPKDLRGEETFRMKVTNTGAQAGLTAASYAVQELGCLGMTLETSYQGGSNFKPYTIKDYQDLGKILVNTLHQWILNS